MDPPARLLLPAARSPGARAVTPWFWELPAAFGTALGASRKAVWTAVFSLSFGFFL